MKSAISPIGSIATKTGIKARRNFSIIKTASDLRVTATDEHRWDTDSAKFEFGERVHLAKTAVTKPLSFRAKSRNLLLFKFSRPITYESVCTVLPSPSHT